MVGRLPRHPLPLDLVDLLTQVNGIHLRADLASLRSYAPARDLCALAEREGTREALWKP